jgi:hypothetical protein
LRHKSQTLEPASAYCSPGQSAQLDWPDVAVLEPFGQSTHNVWPAADWYWPAAQSSHTVRFASGATVPTPQFLLKDNRKQKDALTKTDLFFVTFFQKNANKHAKHCHRKTIAR